MPTEKPKKDIATEQQHMREEGIQHLKKRVNEIRTERRRMQERLQYLQQR